MVLLVLVIALAGPAVRPVAQAPRPPEQAAAHVVDAEDQDAITSLMRASATGDLAKVNALLKQGADPNLQNTSHHVTALMCAAYFGHVNVVKALIAKGARLGLKDVTGGAAVDWASLGDKAELQTLLTGDGAALNPFLNLGSVPMWLMDKAAGKSQ